MFSLRRISQIVVVGTVLFLTLSHMRLGIEKAAPIDAYCPFGAVEGFLTYLTTGEYLKRIFASTFILMGIVLVLTLVFGRVFCSHFCPLGALQEWMRALGKKIGIKKDVELPARMDRVARYFKYMVLLAIIYFSFQFGDLVFRAYDPFNALMHLGEEFDEKIFGYSILAVVIIGSLFSRSWWCRYACPLGAFLGVVRKLSPFKIERNTKTCIGCSGCNRSCPAGLDVARAKAITSADCISCMACVSDCPKSSLVAKVGKKQVSKKQLSGIAAGSFLAAILVAMTLPMWQTKAPSNIVTSAGQLDVENLRGSNTLQYVVDTTHVPLVVLQEKLGLPADVDTSLKLKDIGPKYGLKNSEGMVLETEDFRKTIEEYGKHK